MKRKIVAFAGSNSIHSRNKKLVKFTLSYFDNCEIELLDLNDYEMPIFSVDREKNEGIPEKAKLFRKYMHEADAIVCSMAEHNRSYSVAFKNILDWCSRIDLNIFNKRPMLLMSTSTGGFGGGNVMNLAKSFFQRCGAEIIETYSLPSFNDNFKDEKISDSKLKKELEACISNFKESLDTLG
jgi:chromate reductase, NAD(P)H dehydrogenase (quinone)